jgi:predicted transcriptional regulator of viral defense system
MAPLGVIRPIDLAETYAQPRTEVARLTRRGLLHRLLPGYYATVPPARIRGAWLPELEAAAAGLAAAAYGPDRTVLMGLSAARQHGALPRAIAVAVVAVPRQHAPMILTDRRARVLFVQRDVERLDAERTRTELGPALVTGIEQTVLDLAHRQELGGMADEARDAVSALLPRADHTVLDQLAGDQRLRSALDRALTWAT